MSILDFAELGLRGVRVKIREAFKGSYVGLWSPLPLYTGPIPLTDEHIGFC